MSEMRPVVAGGVCLAAAAALLWVGAPSPVILAWAAVNAAVLVFRPRLAAGVLAVNAGLMAWRGAALAPIYLGSNFDTWMHLAIVRRVVENGPFPPDPFYAGHSAAPLVSLIHHVYAAVAWATDLPIGPLWFQGMPLVALAIAAVAWFFHRELLGNAAAAFFATMFYLVSRYFEWPTPNYPRAIGPVFLLLSLALLLRGLRLDRRRLLVASGLALGLSAAAHPVSGVMSALVVGAVLLAEWALEAQAGRGRAFAPGVFAVVTGALVAAGPWIYHDAVALLAKGETAPILQYAEDSAEGLLFFLSRHVDRILRAGASPGESTLRGLVLWGLPVALGAARLFTSEATRRLRVYVAASIAVVGIAMASPLTGPLLDFLTPRYLARFFYALPFPALAGFGLAWVLRFAKAPASRGAAFALFALYAALLLRSIQPSEPAGIEPVASKLVRPELAKLEPLVRGRVVLAARDLAYELPYFTGAFVAWSPAGHANQWAYDRDRVRGARAILKGRASPDEIRAYCERHGVEFALLPTTAEALRGPLLATGEFHLRERISGYVLYERGTPAR